MADIFISYSQKVPNPAKELEDRLEALGYKTWSDNGLEPGHNFNDSIRKELEDAEAVIVIWSHDATQSQYVKMEAGIAWAWNKLIPVRLTELSANSIPEPFTNLQTIDFSEFDDILRALESRDIRPRSPSKKLTLENILQELSTQDPALPTLLKTWLTKAKAQGFRVVVKRSIIIKSTIPGFGEINFGTLFPDGTVQTNYISESSKKVGAPEIAVNYLDGLSAMFDGGSVSRDGRTEWNWRVEVWGVLPKLSLFLSRGDDWLDLMKTARKRFAEAAASRGVAS